MSENRKHCFVIMPFSQTSKEHTEEYWIKHFESFLKPLIEENPELEAHRSEPLRGDVLRQIITNLVVSPIVVADITDWNPNVFWELGVRQSFHHGTITIAENGTKIPFDVSVKGVLFYFPKDHLKNAEFIKKFRKAIKDCLSHPDSPDSHVLETISGRGTLFEIIRRDEALRRMEALLSEHEWNSGVLDRVYKAFKGEVDGIVTERLRSAAVELLVTQRYLDETPAFYISAEEYFDCLSVTNGQLEWWVHDEEKTQKWFSEAEKLINGIFKSYKKKLLETQKKLVVPLRTGRKSESIRGIDKKLAGEKKML